MNPQTKRFARRLTKLREARATTKGDLAILSGLSRQSIYQLEAAKAEPSLSSLVKLAGALRVTMDELTCYKVPAEPKPTKTDGHLPN